MDHCTICKSEKPTNLFMTPDDEMKQHYCLDNDNICANCYDKLWSAMMLLNQRKVLKQLEEEPSKRKCKHCHNLFVSREHCPINEIPYRHKTVNIVALCHKCVKNVVNENLNYYFDKIKLLNEALQLTLI